MNNTDQKMRRGMTIASIVILLAALALIFAVPNLARPGAIVAFFAALVLAALAFGGGRRAGDAESSRQTADESAVRRESTLNLLRKSKDHQEELAGQVLDTIKLAGQITEILQGTMGSVHSFQKDFDAGGASLDAIGTLIDRFEKLVSELTQVSQQSAAASEEMAASIEHMSAESGSRYEEIKDLADLSRDGQVEMKTSLEIIKKVVASVGTLNGFIASINEIADRTSLLAMNAAIQAAHAGEAGRGFAVVAGEVRKLAASSAESAQAISSRLSELIQSIRKAEETSVNSASIFATVEERVRHATDSFLEIRNGTVELATAGREIRDVVSTVKNASGQIKLASDQLGGEIRSLGDRFAHVREEARHIISNLEKIDASSGDINFNSLTTAQSDIEQLRLSSAVLETSGMTEEEASSLATILKLQHLANVARVRAAIDGRVNMERDAIADADRCELGRWLVGDGAREVRDVELLRELDTTHRAIHAKASEALAAVGRGDRSGAETLSAELARHSEEIVELIGKAFKQRRPAFMSWSRKYVTGNTTIDGQHLRLVELISELADAMDSGRGRDALGGVLEELVDYAASHFKDEERIFDTSSYPDSKMHKAQHEAFTRKALELRESFRSGANILSADTLAFLREWLNGHILGTDKGYVAYIAKG